MDFKTFLNQSIVYLDGGMGTLLQARGLKPGEHPEEWNLSRPEVICDIHKQYFDAGSNLVCTNTFGANTLKFTHERLECIIRAAVENAKNARAASRGEQEKFIALDLGPTGKLLKPLGDLDFEDAVSIFAATVRLGTKYGVDAIVIETMNDSYETKAALLAAKENSTLPVLVTNAYDADQKLMTGATPEAMAALLEAMGADAIGANCSLGPKQLAPIARRLLKCASVPVILKPNSGLPREQDGTTVFDVSPDRFASELKELVMEGLRVVGGCCGTTPEHIRALNMATKALSPLPITKKDITVVSSYSHAVTFSSPVLIGERINPTGKKRFKQALLDNDMDYILSQALEQQDKRVHILDVNVGLPGINEADMLTRSVCQIQAVCDLPLQIDTSDPTAMESALRRYNGKCMINSVNGKRESMDAVFPLVKKYGGVVVALTLDEHGIPDTAEGRVNIARRILAEAEKYGIDKRDIVFDTLAMTVSADANAALVTLEALRRIRCELNCHTSLGISNVSFGLPCRDAVNSTFFALALANGLSSAIMNPFSTEMMRTYYCFNALSGLDANCEQYISVSGELGTVSQAVPPLNNTNINNESISDDLQNAIIKGLKDKASRHTLMMLEHTPALDIVNNHIIPALNTVGKGFEERTVYLPQLLMSAEAAKHAFEQIKGHLSKSGVSSDGATVVLATVYGDIHDIGKNIVKLLLENYGFKVVDLGKNVPCDDIVDAVIAHNAPIVGLSALMTTTVPAMEQAIRLLKEKAPWCRTVVGGAVLTEDYAQKIGADKYARDAMETVRYAQKITEKIKNG
ncbi:MAG: homocysteine S-methyltransferase family protein [Clostridia bacterium]|nr:homocysteine S-methyltransferase family protein [Clostridia bacterium]